MMHLSWTKRPKRYAIFGLRAMRYTGKLMPDVSKTRHPQPTGGMPRARASQSVNQVAAKLRSIKIIKGICLSYP